MFRSEDDDNAMSANDMRRAVDEWIRHQERYTMDRLLAEAAATSSKLDAVCATLERIERLLAERFAGQPTR